MAKYLNEKEGQIAFFKELRLQNEVGFYDYTDGVIDGTLFEFKNVNDFDINKVLSQAIKYLSRMRIKGESIPANILLIDLTDDYVYHYKSENFLKQIEVPYIGSPSKILNILVQNPIPEAEFKFDDRNGVQKIYDILDDKSFVPVNIDENCVIGWAQRFYKEKPTAKKAEMFSELKNPIHFQGLIKEWTGEEKDFSYIMDCLNDNINKKELGAFYTPTEYCKISAEMVRRAITDIETIGNEWVIIDRCAGTGNLERVLTGAELAKTIVATYELKEWQVLNYWLGDKVLLIIPPVLENLNRPALQGENLYTSYWDKENPNINGLLVGGDALAVKVFPQIQQIISDIEKEGKIVNVIMLENPPYRNDIAGNDRKNGEVKRMGDRDYVYIEMQKDLPSLPNQNISTVKDKFNRFVWSAFKYYLTKPDDQYIVFGPAKYWKTLGLGNYKFMEGCLFNRKHFHAAESAITCIRFKNNYENSEEISLQSYDILEITNETKAVAGKQITIKKCHNTFTEYFDKREFENDIETSCYCEDSGNEVLQRKCDGKSYFNKNILGYLVPKGSSLSAQDIYLMRMTRYNIRGFYLRSDNYLTKLPLFCAKLFPQKEWFERDIYFTTSDKGTEYEKDEEFLRQCFIFTCLDDDNKCISFHSKKDGRFYRNELCFDGDTVANLQLQTYNSKLNAADTNILKLWNDVLTRAKETEEYKTETRENFTYGLWQIQQELNTWIDENGKVYSAEQRKIYNKQQKELKSKKQLSIRYKHLNSAISALTAELKNYYKSELQDKLFEYELLK